MEAFSLTLWKGAVENTSLACSQLGDVRLASDRNSKAEQIRGAQESER